MVSVLVAVCLTIISSALPAQVQDASKLMNLGPKNLALKAAKAGKTAMAATKIPERDLSGMRDSVLAAAAKKRGTNAQTTAYGKAMNSAFKNTKVFGMPGK